MAELAASQRVSTLGTEVIAAAEHRGGPLWVWDGDDGPGIRAAAAATQISYERSAAEAGAHGPAIGDLQCDGAGVPGGVRARRHDIDAGAGMWVVWPRGAALKTTARPISSPMADPADRAACRQRLAAEPGAVLREARREHEHVARGPLTPTRGDVLR